ncbi:DUF2971 domain-containing protein [uncultured Dubosiella sp.]|uniref:DUF2971 domain-containing protein n=1 Tax=uncultured Dubosiella sp. TaxID=1937011 RepID=UPI002584D2C2|nr:DUF2971 domain-containing protein [uncultured Dubosiella sp.]
MEYLYHYTSLETLALILKNKTICFNNLLYVDDIEEAETQDMGKFGKLIYVSCWTEDSEESIPLWNLYTPNMHGVRIRMPRFPFKKYRFNKGDFYLTEDIETYIDFKKIYKEDKASIVSSEPHLEKIEYTDDQDKLFPKIITESCEKAVEKYLCAKDINDILENKNELSFSFSLKDIGRYKRLNWAFQKEWRYIISISPMGLKEMNPTSFEKQKELIRRIQDTVSEPPYKQLFLEINDVALDEIEIIFGPRMSEAEKIMAVALIKEYCPQAVYKESALKIR